MPSPNPKTYGIHEIFGPTIQGEGPLAGTPCVFIRFAGCNMWDGRPETREESQCPFCDTDFLSKTKMTVEEIVQRVKDLTGNYSVQWVWVSGGEPALQFDIGLGRALRRAGYQIGMETNGTRQLGDLERNTINHLVVSPKMPWDFMWIKQADTLKLLYPHPNPKITPEAFSSFAAAHRYLQPIDPGEAEGWARNTQDTIQRLLDLPGWRLSVQTHKYIGVP